MKKIAIYYRVSTEFQELRSQQHEVERWLDSQNPKPEVIIYQDLAISGSKRFNRPGYLKMMKDAEAKKFDTIVVYKLDRFSRDANTAILTILHLDSLGIEFVSVTQEVLNLTNGNPFRRTMLAAFAEIAQLEREAIVSRVKSGLAAAVKRGVKLGAPIKVKPEIWPKILQLREEGKTFKEISKELSISVGAVHRGFVNAKKLKESRS